MTAFEFKRSLTKEQREFYEDMIHELLETENRLYLKIDDLSVQVAVLSRELKRLDPTLVKGEGGEGT